MDGLKIAGLNNWSSEFIFAKNFHRVTASYVVATVETEDGTLNLRSYYIQGYGRYVEVIDRRERAYDGRLYCFMALRGPNGRTVAVSRWKDADVEGFFEQYAIPA